MSDSLHRLTEGSAGAEVALVARLSCGDAQALDPLYRRYKGIVYRFALLWSSSQAIAAEVQDVFLEPRLDAHPDKPMLRKGEKKVRMHVMRFGRGEGRPGSSARRRR